jgi:glycogen debranching enzyme
MFDDGEVGGDGGVTQMENLLRIAKEEFGLLSLTDVVLNHTANNSPWLQEHPEAGKSIGTHWRIVFTDSPAGYSPASHPHLTPALELDDVIIQFSASLKSNGLPTHVNSESDIETLTSAFGNYLKQFNFWEYYVLDVQQEKENVREVLKSGKARTWDGPDVKGRSDAEIATIVREYEDGRLVGGLGKFSKRFGASVDAAIAAGIVQAAVNSPQNTDALVDHWGRVVDVLNVPLYQECEDDTKMALDNIKSRLKYTRLDEHGPRLGEITKKYVAFPFH